jgi:competence protein ComGF
MNCIVAFVLIACLLIIFPTAAFTLHSLTDIHHRTSTISLKLYTLPENAVELLESMKVAAASQQDTALSAKLEDSIQKYATYKEVKLMLNKLRNMWKNEASPRRRDRQFKSFLQLYRGKVS